MSNPQSYAAVLDDIRGRGPVSPRDVTKLLQVSWLTAQKLLDGMSRDGLLLAWRVDESLVLYGACHAS